jgi:DNA-binding GntR family transcriptional regulator
MNTTRIGHAAQGRGTGRKLLADVVRDKLHQSLASGVFPPGSKLPSEDVLAEQYQVSRVTLREAVRGLVEEGYLSRQHGLGTYATRRPRLSNNLDVNFGVTHLIQSLGMTPGNKDARVREEMPSRKVSRALALDPAEPVAVLERIRTADGQPVVWSVEYMPKAVLVNGIEDLEQLPGSLYDLLGNLGHPIHHGIATIKAVLADTKSAQSLLIKPGSPLLYLEQIDYGKDDRPKIFSLEWYPTDDLEFTVYRKGPE